MSAGFRVDPELLVARARQVDAVAGRVRVAAGSGRPLDLRAYGLVGQVFALAAATTAAAGSAAVARLATRADDQAAQLRATAADYRRIELTTAAGLGGPR